MKLPTWSEFTTKLSEIEQDIEQKVQSFKDSHPLLDDAIKTSMSFFPPPFDSVAKRIYDSFDGSEEEKSAAVLNYFKYLQSQGEKHYNNVTLQLNDILDQIQDVKTIMAKQSSIDTIQAILISTANTTNQTLDQLVKDLKEMGIKVDRIDQKTNAILARKTPILQYGRLIVSKSTYYKQDETSRYFVEVVNTVPDTLAEKCQGSISL